MFTYTLEDSRGLTDTAIVTVTVDGVNDAPRAQDDTAATQENSPVSIPVLVNDIDIDQGATLQIAGFYSDTMRGTLSIGVGDTVMNYVPGNDFNYLGAGGTYTVTFGYTADVPVLQGIDFDLAAGQTLDGPATRMC